MPLQAARHSAHPAAPCALGQRVHTPAGTPERAGLTVGGASIWEGVWKCSANFTSGQQASST
eukprot:349601-Chlamydomonas_euryale.AAC.6